MRNLVFLALLTAATGACRDAVSPGDAAGATLSEASDRAHLDLREERASLIAAGNALSAAIAQQGVVPALGAAFAEDALLLTPRVNTIVGRTAALAFLTSDPLRATALRWETIVADVANDGTQGYTWGQGFSTVDLGTGPLERPTYFLTYWRRADGGEWKIAAMVVSLLGGPPGASVPAEFGTPTTKHRRNFPNTETTQQRADVLAADGAFSALSLSRGSGPAFEAFAAPNAIAVSGPNFVFGPPAIGVEFSSGPDDVISWVPRFSDAAASGDLGFSVGDATFVFAGIGTFYSKYLTVWQKQNTGEWKFVADLGNNRPAPTP
ncbi:MAG TPA: nuclear transport factor 2 family protein [Gemmatimonadales bacterium]|nr:nuclear transport factor 2 family protein [Gemmatimonadales bacterium]